ncbi:TolB family protein [Tahibacter sp. UC22_41]|uniref:TolB family protein n=1 Tax=Tahibacter sp. UC22_41 TaxID=3350178 RepID=UPI0036D7BF84
MNKSRVFRTCLIVAAIAALPAAAGAAELEIVNRTTLVGAIDSNGDSSAPHSASFDGRYALFSSRASNLVPGDTNGRADLFLHDAQTHTLERVSVGNDGAQANGEVGTVGSVSDDGRYVVFDSKATNLVPGATSGVRQIYLRDRSNGTTTLLSRIGNSPTPLESANPRLSGDGRYVVFESSSALVAEDDNDERDVYRLDRSDGSLELISVSADGRRGNNASYDPQISADGSSVLFYTWANNLVPGDVDNSRDLLLRKPTAGTTQRVSVNSTGAGFASFPLAANQALTADGRYALFNTYQPAVAGDTNGASDGYRFDSADGSVQRVTLGVSHTQLTDYSSANAISRDGRWLLMHSSDPDLPGASGSSRRHYLCDLSDGVVYLVGFHTGGMQAQDETDGGALSGDGNIVFASSRNDGLADDDHNDMHDALRYRSDLVRSERLSLPHAGSAGAFANGHSGAADTGFDLSADGRYVVFDSDADNLVVGDFNGVGDVFLRDRLLGETLRISRRAGGAETHCRSFSPKISRDGRYIVFVSCDALTPYTFGGSYEVFRYDRQTSQMRLVSQGMVGLSSGGLNTHPSISDDGRYVAFSSSAALVAGDENGFRDCFVRDMDSGVNVLASRTPDGNGSNWDSLVQRLSGDGRYLLFTSNASNLVAGDTNGASDGFVFDRLAQTVERVTLGNAGLEPDGSSYPTDISRDGRLVAFTSNAPNLTGATPIPYSRAFVRDRLNGTTEQINRRNDGELLNGGSSDPKLSDDGNRVVFRSSATNSGLPAASGLVFRYFLYERAERRLSSLAAFGENDYALNQPALSGDGDHFVFSTRKADLVADDGNNQFSDVFLAQRLSDFLFADGYEAAE